MTSILGISGYGIIDSNKPTTGLDTRRVNMKITADINNEIFQLSFFISSTSFISFVKNEKKVIDRNTTINHDKKDRNKKINEYLSNSIRKFCGSRILIISNNGL